MLRHSRETKLKLLMRWTQTGFANETSSTISAQLAVRSRAQEITLWRSHLLPHHYPASCPKQVELDEGGPTPEADRRCQSWHAEVNEGTGIMEQQRAEISLFLAAAEGIYATLHLDHADVEHLTSEMSLRCLTWRDIFRGRLRCRSLSPSRV